MWGGYAKESTCFFIIDTRILATFSDPMCFIGEWIKHNVLMLAIYKCKQLWSRSLRRFSIIKSWVTMQESKSAPFGLNKQNNNKKKGQY